MHPENFKDMEKYANLLDIAIVNLKEANHFEELQDGLVAIYETIERLRR